MTHFNQLQNTPVPQHSQQQVLFNSARHILVYQTQFNPAHHTPMYQTQFTPPYQPPLYQLQINPAHHPPFYLGHQAPLYPPYQTAPAMTQSIFLLLPRPAPMMLECRPPIMRKLTS